MVAGERTGSFVLLKAWDKIRALAFELMGIWCVLV